jgi:hypothetical protein
MNSLTLSEISFSITKHLSNLDDLVRAPGFTPTWFEKLNGQPKRAKSFTGNFAVTYHFRGGTGGGKQKDFGIRLWHSKIHEHDLERYRKIGEELKNLNQKSPNHIRFAPMELLEPEQYGFFVKGNRHPCLKMEWQDAENLDVFVDRIIKDRSIPAMDKANALREIKQKIIQTGEVLRENRCSHGDLSSGNIMISQNEKTNSFSVHIVDFDSFYSQALSTLNPSSLGHQDWQHPKYISGQMNLYGLEADFCPLLCLIITLEALATDIGLYDQFSPPAQDGSGILIRRKDLVNPNQSPVFNEIEDLGNSILSCYLDDLKSLLAANSKAQMKLPDSLSTSSTAVSRPSLQRLVLKQKEAPKQRAKSWSLRRKIETEAHLLEALEQGATQMTILKAMASQSFRKRFNAASMLRFYETITQHFGGLENCEEEVQTQYVWALKNAGQEDKALQIAMSLLDENPGNPHLGYMVFLDLSYKKKWTELFEKTTRSLDLQPTNVNVNIFHSTALMHLEHNGDVEAAFADARIRTNDNWQLLCGALTVRNRTSYKPEYLGEIMTSLMEISKTEKFKDEVTGRNKIKTFSHAILEFILRSGEFPDELVELLLRLEPDAMRMCLELPQNWKKTVLQFFNTLTMVEDMENAAIYLETNRLSKLSEILSLLCIWGRGEPEPELAIYLQMMIYNFGWQTIDQLAMGLSFDAATQENDPLIVYNNGSWTYFRDRTKNWSGNHGNIFK